MASSPLSLEESVRLACALEARAPKPGNVHPCASFSDLTFRQLVTAGNHVAPILADTRARGVGRAILDAVLETNRVVQTNANLGIILLFAPLCAADWEEGSLRESVDRVLRQLTVEDARLAYEAIRASGAGGLGKAVQEDVQQAPTVTLLEAMRLAQGRDGVARQYVTAFEEIIEWSAPSLADMSASGLSIDEAVVWSHILWMALFPDSLIARKCGTEMALESARRAHSVIQSLGRNSDERAIPQPGFLENERLQNFDGWLREDGNRRNPGTSADLVAASLFVAIRTGALPIREQDRRLID